MLRKGRHWLVLGMASLLLQCKIDYENIVVLENIPTGVPTIELGEVRYTQVENFRVLRYLEAEKMAIHQQPEMIILKGGSFLSFSDGQRLDLSGTVSSASYDRGSKDATVDGKVFIRSEKDGISLNTENVRWFNEKRSLEGDPDSKIKVTRSNGSWLSGKGLKIDMTSKTVHYRSDVRGVLVVD